MIRIIIFLALGFAAWLIFTSPQQLKTIFTQFSTAGEVVADVNQPSSTKSTDITEINVSESEIEPSQPELTQADSGIDTEEQADHDTSTVEEDTDTAEQHIPDSDNTTNVALVSEDSNDELAATTDSQPAAANTQNEPLLADNTTSDQNESGSNTTESKSLAQSHTAVPFWGQGLQNPMTNNPYMNMMTPMFNMMNPMISMMGSMMNPAAYMNPMAVNPMAMMQYPMNSMTHPQMMNPMMMSMNPNLMFGMFGQPSAAYKNGEVPDQLPVITVPGFPTQSYQKWPKNTVSESISREAKMNAFQTAMAMSPLSMRNMVSMMAEKIPVAEDVTWDDAVEAMKLRANEVNFKFVGSSPLWKQIEAETEEPSAKVEMFRFCDARMARKILDEVPEFIVFLPCKIALLEDAEGKLWVMTLDWDVKWLDYAQNSNSHLSKDIREHATRIRESIAYIMEGAATGDF